jgi:leucyl-tRNA synthetase
MAVGNAMAEGGPGSGRDEVTIAVQVNGKRRDEIRVAKGLPREQIEAIVLKLDGK